MSYIATAYNVMIASPGDVEAERNIVRDVIHEWNIIHSESREIVLLPVGWDTHASPEMGGPPQDIINEKVLSRCDLLVGIFWTRIGTPTRNHASGTVEEIEEHIKTGKPAMLYFSQRPAVPDSIDAEQYAQVKAFKDSCKDRGIYETYDGLTDFPAKFFRHLQIMMNDSSYFPIQQESNEAPLALDDMPQVASMPRLSTEAQELLVEAVKDDNGTIIFTRHLGGTSLQTNKKNFIPDKSPRREIAKWEAAIEELVYEELVVDHGYKGQIFEVTSSGYAVVDSLGRDD